MKGGGWRVNGLATRADLALLDGTKLDAAAIQRCLGELQSLPRMSSIADKCDYYERLFSLETVQMMDRHGPGYLEAVSGGTQDSQHFLQQFMGQIFLNAMDWEPALRRINHWYDRLGSTMRQNERGKRIAGLEQIENDIKAVRSQLTGPIRFLEVFSGTKTLSTSTGEALGDIWVCLMLPAISRVDGAADRTEQNGRNLRLAFALAAYQREHGRYPDKLADLGKAVSPNDALDIFAGKPLSYRSDGESYQFQSVGQNGKDEGGRSSDDDPKGDDLTVRMPLPALPKK